jgi:hypothetical protein
MTFFTFQSCKKTGSSAEQTDTETFASESESLEAYPDGTYAADVEYYNPETGTRNTYTLNVEVESNEVTVIHWPNGGWLDESHFTPQELDSDGTCSFTSGQGYEYNIQIAGEETSYTDESRLRNDAQTDHYAVTCPECGFKKNQYEEMCYNCQRKKKNIAEHTCKRCGEYDTFMWSSNDLCSDCERDDEDKKRQEEEENNN